MNEPTSHPQDAVIRARSREAFEQSVADLDQATGNRLRLMRREALARARPQARSWALPFAATAVAVLAIGLAWRAGLEPGIPAATGPTAVDEVSANGFPTEEDAELYAWLGEAPVAPSKGEAL